MYAYWGDRVAEDLRHEVAHGYLHAVVPNLPLWLDEGLAEYFEVPRGQDGVNRPHVELSPAVWPTAGGPIWRGWKNCAKPTDMTQNEYAESWAWVAFPAGNVARAVANRCRTTCRRWSKSQKPEPLSEQLRARIRRSAQNLLEHLTVVASVLAIEHASASTSLEAQLGEQRRAAGFVFFDVHFDQRDALCVQLAE